MTDIATWCQRIRQADDDELYTLVQAMMGERRKAARDFPLSHEACDAFWRYWSENGETHRHGYYESTWGAIGAYLKTAAVTKDQRAKPEPPKEPT